MITTSFPRVKTNELAIAAQNASKCEYILCWISTVDRSSIDPFVGQIDAWNTHFKPFELSSFTHTHTNTHAPADTPAATDTQTTICG